MLYSTEIGKVPLTHIEALLYSKDSASVLKVEKEIIETKGEAVEEESKEEKKEEVSAEKEEGYIDPKLEEEYIFLAGHV